MPGFGFGEVPFTLPDGIVEDVAAAKAAAAAAKLATDALALRGDANDELDTEQGAAISGNGARIVALEEGRVMDLATLALHEAALHDDADELAAHAGRLDAIDLRLSASEALLAAHTLTLNGLASARDAHAASIASAATSIAALQAAVTALQGGGAANAAAIASAQAAILALQNKVAADETTATALAQTVATLQAAQTADEAKAAAQAADIASLKGSRTADEAAIASANGAIAALQANRTTDAAAIAANAAAITALQGTVATAQQAITANGTAIASLQASRTADEASIVQNSARLTALEAGAPYIYGRSRLVVASTDNAVTVETYRVFRGPQGAQARTYTFSLVNPSVANALSITADGKLTTVAQGFDTVAAEGLITVSVRATDDLGVAMPDLSVTVVRRAFTTGTTKTLLLGMVRLSASGTWSKADMDVAYPGWDELDVRCTSGGSSGWTVSGSGGVVDATGAFGGLPGAVARADRLQRADLPATVSYVVGAGGAVPGNDGFRRCNGGSGSAFGSYVRSAAGLTSACNDSGSVNALRDLMLSTVASIYVAPWPGGNRLNAYGGLSSGGSVVGNNGFQPQPALGPGAGGGGGFGAHQDVAVAGGAGGIGDNAGAQTPGGVGAVNAAGTKGSDGAVGSFGGGGAGGGGSASSGTNPVAPYAFNGGDGGYPGGGGGGSGVGYNTATSPTGQRAAPGKGGDGEVLLYVKKRISA